MNAAWSLIKQTFQEWQEDRVPVLAASLAYYTVFSLAPLLIIVIAVLSFFGQGDAQSQIVQQLQGALGEDAAGLIRTMIEQRAERGGNVLATVIGVAILLVGATGVFSQLQTALNTIWDVRPDPESGGLWRIVRVRLLSLGMILTMGFLLLVSLVLSTALSAIASSLDGLLPGSDLLWVALNWLLSLGIITLLFALLFQYLPDAKIPWRTVWVGALVTALLFVIGKELLGLYLSRGSVASAYGAAGSLVVLLLWVFYSAQIVLLGGEFTQVYTRRYAGGIEPAEHALKVNDKVVANDDGARSSSS